MANVRDRGQLILIMGLLIAVTMVSLVLLLNTAIYTENIASRGTDQGPREVLEYRGVLIEGVEGLVVAENAREEGSWSDLHGRTRQGILLIDNYTARSRALHGAAAGINESSLTVLEGRLIRQNDNTRPFTGASGATGWDVARNVEGARNYSMTVNAADLNRTSAADAQSDDAFRVIVSDGTDTWRAYIYEDDSTGAVTLATKVGAGSTTAHCSLSDTQVTLDLSEGTLDGSGCSGYTWAEGVSTPYDIRYERGANATGTYNLTIDETGTTGYPDLNGDGATSPFHLPAVYGVTFDVYAESPGLRYRTPVRVVPGVSP